MNSYQMVLHRPVETARLIGKFGFDVFADLRVRPTHIQISARVRGRGVLPSMSVQPYSTATLAATSTVPVYRMTSGSAASAATARPMNSGDSEFVRSSQGAASMTFSVLTNPGYKDTAATPCGRNSTAISAVILSVAAFDTP